MYRSKYDEANKKLFGKGRAISNLVSEIQAFASFNVQAAQIPAILADIELYQKQEMAHAANKQQISFEWKQLMEVYPTMQALSAYKEKVKCQLVIVSKFSGKLQQLEQNGKRGESIAIAKKVVEAYKTVYEKEAGAVAPVSYTHLTLPTNSRV